MGQDPTKTYQLFQTHTDLFANTDKFIEHLFEVPSEVEFENMTATEK